MATAPPSVAVCCRCQSLPDGPLVHLASGGSLLAVCEPCFLLDQLGELTAQLLAGDSSRVLVLEGLRTVYEVALARCQELALEEARHGSEAHR